MVTIKAGVQPRSLYILAAAANVAQQLGLDAVVTAGSDGKHMAGSLHYTHRALDLRSKHLTAAQKTAFLDALKARLGLDYQAFLEAAGTGNEHFHIEYQPVQ